MIDPHTHTMMHTAAHAESIPQQFQSSPATFAVHVAAIPSTEASTTPIPPDDATCVVCLDVLTHPVSVRSCNHAFCSLCLHQVIAASLQQQYDQVEPPLHAPLAACPLCRSDILRMADLEAWDPARFLHLHSQHPALIAAKLQSTHAPALQHAAVQQVHRLAAQLLQKRMRCPQARRRAAGGAEGARDDSDVGEELLEWFGGKNKEFVMLTVELVGLLYAFVLYLGLVWCKMGRFVSF